MSYSAGLVDQAGTYVEAGHLRVFADLLIGYGCCEERRHCVSGTSDMNSVIFVCTYDIISDG